MCTCEKLDRPLVLPSADLRPGARHRHFRTAIDVAVNVGVGHIVLISSAAARQVADSGESASFWLGEQHVMKTASRWTILRMNDYADMLAQVARVSRGTGVLSGLGESRVGFVSRDEVAAAAPGFSLAGTMPAPSAVQTVPLR